MHDIVHVTTLARQSKGNHSKQTPKKRAALSRTQSHDLYMYMYIIVHGYIIIKPPKQLRVQITCLIFGLPSSFLSVIPLYPLPLPLPLPFSFQLSIVHVQITCLIFWSLLFTPLFLSSCHVSPSPSLLLFLLPSHFFPRSCSW